MYMNMLHILKTVFYSVGKMYWLKIMVIVKVELTFVEKINLGGCFSASMNMRCFNCTNVKTKNLKNTMGGRNIILKILRADVGGKKKSQNL